MRYRYYGFIGFLLLVVATPATPVAFAGDKSKIMIVLDASGSMWGQIEGKAKIQIAREVIADLLRDWDPNIQLGLTAYGHRRKGDCNDIEVLIPAGQAGPKEIIQTINSINPKGKTPLSEAVRRAAKELRYTEERAIVVLITDGAETCNADPCEVGAELAMGGVDFTAHVIGFDVKDEEQIGLRCLAENTGGLFLAATDAQALRRALSQTVEKAKEPPAPVIEEPGDASLKAPSEVPAGSIIRVHWEGPDSRNDFVTIVTRNAPEDSYLNYAYTSMGNPVSITAPDEVGAYEVRYVFGHKRITLAKSDINVTPVEASLVPPSEVAAGGFFKIGWTGPDNRGDYITIVPAGASDKEYMSYAYTSKGSPATIKAPDKPGEYEVRYILDQSRSALARVSVVVK